MCLCLVVVCVLFYMRVCVMCVYVRAFVLFFSMFWSVWFVSVWLVFLWVCGVFVWCGVCVLFACVMFVCVCCV